jgi:hypothetical protein
MMVNLAILSVTSCERPRKEGNAVFFPPSAEDDIHSDLQRLDAHAIQPEEYEEIPELSEMDLAEAVIRG